MKNIEKRKCIAWILAIMLVFATCQPSVFAGMLPAKNGVEQIVMSDKQNKADIKISKTDMTNSGVELAGAKLTVTMINNAAGEEVSDVIESWTSDGTVHEIDGLTDGTYTLVETSAPSGYEVAESITFVIKDGKLEDDENSANGVVTMQDAMKRTDIRISKIDAGAGNELAGATLTLMKEGQEEAVDSWISDGSIHTVAGLTDGTYTLVEENAPEGYKKAESITFSIKDDRLVENGNDAIVDGVVIMADEKYEGGVSISKQVLGQGTELAGAELTVTRIADASGNEVSELIDSWTTDGALHEISYLDDGTYVLTETSAPEGYEVAESIEFTLMDGKLVDDENSANGVVTMQDAMKRTDIRISKVDAGAGNELAGAELTVKRIVNIAGEEVSDVIESWTSDGTAHEIDGLTDGAYTLVEMSAPSGYKVAEPITFVIKDGKLVDDENSANGVVTMHDELYRMDVQISKVDAGEGNELAGAELTVKRIVNIAGEEVSDEIESWTSNGTAHEIDGLTDGTYTLVEMSAPSGYKVAEPITFVIKDGKLVEDGNASEGVVTMKDVMTKVQVSKVDIEDGEELEGATIQILDKDGGVVCEWISTKEPHVIEGLKTNEEYTLKETVAPSGYTLAGETTFTIDESGKVTSTGTISGEGVLLVEDQKTSITMSIADKEGKAIEGVKLQILDEKGNVVAEWWSGKDGHTIEGLNPGEYTLKVVTSPDGYEDAAPITFTLEADGTVKINGEEAEVIMMTTEKITVPPKPTYRFSDVTDPEHAYFNAIYWAADKGITKGYPDGTFGINRSCTRGEMMMFLWRYAGKPAPKWSSKSPFKDVKKDHVFYRAILWGFQKGITKGYSDGTFGIDRSVSRGEAMMFLWRLKGKPAPKAAAKSPFKDVPKTHVFYKAILWAYQKEVVTGYTSGKNKGKYMINEYCSRGQVVTFLYRVK